MPPVPAVARPRDGTPAARWARLGWVVYRNPIARRYPAPENGEERTKERYAVPDLVKMMEAPNVRYGAVPYATEKFAAFMFKTGLLKTQAKSWKDFFFADVHDRAGS